MDKVYMDGLDEILTAFKEVINEASNDAVVAATKTAAELVRDAAKSKHAGNRKRPGTGDLYNAIEARPYKSTKKKYSQYTSQPVYTVGVRPTTMTGAKGANYGAHVELGHMVKVHGRFVGVSEERPFLRPAADENIKKVEAILIGAINKALEKFKE